MNMNSKKSRIIYMKKNKKFARFFRTTSKHTRRRVPRFNRGVPKAEERSDEAGMLSYMTVSRLNLV